MNPLSNNRKITPQYRGTSIIRYLDITYYVKLFSSFVFLYYFNVFYWGLTDPNNYYIYFLDHYINYINWLSVSILYIASLITPIFGVESHIEPPQVIKTIEGTNVILTFACLGLGTLSFWVAFVIANNGTFQKKIYWCLGGIAFIWFINCCRIALLLTALEKRWVGNKYMDHHDLFNVVSYIIILALIYFHSKEDRVDLQQCAGGFS